MFTCSTFSLISLITKGLKTIQIEKPYLYPIFQRTAGSVGFFFCFLGVFFFARDSFQQGGLSILDQPEGGTRSCSAIILTGVLK